VPVVTTKLCLARLPNFLRIHSPGLSEKSIV
jgi:hypothetical protein